MPTMCNTCLLAPSPLGVSPVGVSSRLVCLDAGPDIVDGGSTGVRDVWDLSPWWLERTMPGDFSFFLMRRLGVGK
ncbi:hypothetical protein GGTG_14369 [Gaeumannomyces tritici R3-111a-1]|uniref:Uncharacterized protein n=1 Tax=Gaeumannomyces tritici (strain R3-111a-1) TaxID=644352 RepID=J3PLB1_GAET3|nr:hypothetical protein GGTG_14369 [Gaeumannomyces tritici R3-111a-1]EJT68052.1 hypothetical protein GGTG_14369 [Gaeumannomyces tritici R3-111a-1]